MRREILRIESARDRRRIAQEVSLFACNHAQLRQTRERTFVFSIRLIGMCPRIEARRRLWQSSEKNRFGQRQVARRFTEVRARRRFRSEPAIAVARAVQIFGENPFLAPTPLGFPRDDRFIKLPEPTATLPA